VIQSYRPPIEDLLNNFSNTSREIFANETYNDKRIKIPILLGQHGQKAFFKDLSKLGNLYISVKDQPSKTRILRSILFSVLLKGYPDEVKFVIINTTDDHTFPHELKDKFLVSLPFAQDPLNYNLLTAFLKINSISGEMERRFETLKNAHCMNLIDYNSNIGEKNPSVKLPFIVIIINELNSLLEGELGGVFYYHILRILQLSQATGIFSIICNSEMAPVEISNNSGNNDLDALKIISETSAMIGEGTGSNQDGEKFCFEQNNEVKTIQTVDISEIEFQRISDYVTEQRIENIYMLPEFFNIPYHLESVDGSTYSFS